MAFKYSWNEDDFKELQDLDSIDKLDSELYLKYFHGSETLGAQDVIWDDYGIRSGSKDEEEIKEEDNSTTVFSIVSRSKFNYLREFHYPKKNYPKKEYCREFFLRLWKKNLRLKQVNRPIENFVEFSFHYNNNRTILDKEGPTESGPNTEAINIRSNQSKHNSFNDNYVKVLFTDLVKLDSFRFFVIDFFEDFRKCDSSCLKVNREKESISAHSTSCNQQWCTDLSTTLGFGCCETIRHKSDCPSKNDFLCCKKFKHLKTCDKRFGFQCCKVVSHQVDCPTKFERLKFYTISGMILQYS